MRLSVATLFTIFFIPFMATIHKGIASELDHDRELTHINGGASSVIVDGNISPGEWLFIHNIATLKIDGGANDGQPVGKVSARYNPGILCVLVETIFSNSNPVSYGEAIWPSGGPSQHWIKVDGNSAPPPLLSQVFDTSGPPQLWEACYTVNQPPCDILVHTFVGAFGTDNLEATAQRTFNSGAPHVCGDPHLQSWGGVQWDYHGECDLVAIRNPNFADGLGLELHIRTTRDHHYSFTNEAALKIGDDIFEVHSMSHYSLNGVSGDYKNSTTDTLAGFQLSHWHSGNQDNLFFHRHLLKLSETGDKIEIKTFENIIYIEIGGTPHGIFQGSTGLFGDADSGKLIGRDGVTEFEPSDDYALEWQVRDIDPKLFSTNRAPIYPEKCYPPKQFIPRLGHIQVQKQAEELCAAWENDMDSCVFDVMASGNKDLAHYKAIDAVAKAAEFDEEQGVVDA